VAEFPASPISPAEFLESFVTDAFSELDLPEALKRLDLQLGVRLDGEGGGEWLYTLRGGALEVAAGSREKAAFTLIQSVDDWRGALWEGRSGVVAERALALLRAVGRRALAERAADDPDPGGLERLAALDGVMRAVVTGGPTGDWSTAFKFGPGEIPAEPTTTLSIHYDDAVALARREISPLEAFLAGRISVAGDMLLVMQVQAILLEAAEAGRGGP
jgi:putative sterol carrier protein